MRLLILISLTFFTVLTAPAQEIETNFAGAVVDAVEEFESSATLGAAKTGKFFLREFEKNLTFSVSSISVAGRFAKPETLAPPAAAKDITDPVGPRMPRPATEDKFHWKPALKQSMAFLAFQHAFRMTEKKTRQELGGPFFADWGKSMKGLQGWRDSDNFGTNYIAHPLQGSLTGRIFVNNSDRAKKQEFGKSKEYWVSRFKAFAWSTFWSTQFELGPISEASIGNVGIRKKRGYSTMGYVDLVMTPVGGTALLVGEDAIDKYVLKNWLERKSGKLKIRILRSFLTPTRSAANLLRGKVPWRRDDRPIE